MRIGQLAKMIREADPAGEAYVMDDDFSVPRFIEAKEGYYDGAYAYIDEQGRYVKEDKEHKADVLDDTLGWLVWEHLDYELSKMERQAVLNGGAYAPTKDEMWDLLMSMITFEDDVPIDFRNGIAEGLEKTFKEWMEYKEKSDAEWLEKAMEEMKKGYDFFEPKEHDGWCVWKMTKDAKLLGIAYDALRKLFKGNDHREHCDGVCLGMIDALTTSGRFERVSYDEKWWQWKLKQ